LKLLLDTHALIWWLSGDAALPKKVIALIDDPANEIWVSAVSAFEITTKFRIGKLPQAEELALNFEAARGRQGFQTLPIREPHALRAGLMQGAHRDPFDRLLIAQALVEDLVLVSNEVLFDGFGVQRIW
jgi:PIN domain nuclease of toxin-antitoxin system